MNKQLEEILKGQMFLLRESIYCIKTHSGAIVPACDYYKWFDAYDNDLIEESSQYEIEVENGHSIRLTDNYQTMPNQNALHPEEHAHHQLESQGEGHHCLATPQEVPPQEVPPQEVPPR